MQNAKPDIECFTCRNSALVSFAHRDILIMPASELWASALSLLLIHSESGCNHSAFNAALVLERLSETVGLDEETRNLCERASSRLLHRN